VQSVGGGHALLQPTTKKNDSPNSDRMMRGPYQGATETKNPRRERRGLST
jgi:hypothetical protein